MIPIGIMPTDKGISKEELDELENEINLAMRDVDSFYNLAESFDCFTWGRDNVNPEEDTVVLNKLSRLKDSILVYNTLYDDMAAPMLTLCSRLVDNEINTLYNMYQYNHIPHALIPKFNTAVSSLAKLMLKYISISKKESKVYKKSRVKYNDIALCKVYNFDLCMN